MDPSLVEQFTSITGSTSSIAEQYLRLGDRDLEQAIGLFYANEGAELEPPAPNEQNNSTSSSMPRSNHRGPGYTDEDGVVHLDSDDGDEHGPGTERRSIDLRSDRVTIPQERSRSGAADASHSTPPAAPEDTIVEDDEAIARRLQEEFYGDSRPGDAPSSVDEFGYRAPIARTTQTLVGPDSYDLTNTEDMRAAVMEQMIARRQPRPRGDYSVSIESSGGILT